VRVEYQTIPVGQLLLDVENPRHEPVRSQRDAIAAVISGQRQRLVVLANDIAQNGLSPIDRMLVVKSGRNFVVVEGNRRLAAIKLLANPGLAAGTPVAAAISRVASNATLPAKVDCSVAPSRADAEHWLELRHTGMGEGAGIVPWNTLAKHRFSHKPGTQAAKAIAFLEALAEGYPNNDVIQELVVAVAEKRLTTLGRLVADPSFKQHVGMREGADGTLAFHYPAKDLQDTLETVLGDIGSDVSVSQLKSKSQRTDYLKSVPRPSASKRVAKAQPLSKAPATAKSTGSKKRTRRQSKPQKPFKHLDLSKLGMRTDNIVREFAGLDVDKFPNASAVLARVILELSVDRFIAKKNLSNSGNLKNRIKRCLHKVDPTDKDATFQAVRQGLSDGTSFYAVSTLHGYVHNPHFHPDGSAIRSIAANLEPFLQALNDVA
jgi:hypothetical protein